LYLSSLPHGLFILGMSNLLYSEALSPFS
jgi:hypothetical protein